MSRSTASYENIARVAFSLYNDKLPTYFSTDHEDLICEAISYICGLNSYAFTRTNVVMIEPLTHINLDSNKYTIILSIPLIGQLINAPIRVPKFETEILQNADIFENLTNAITASKETRTPEELLRNIDDLFNLDDTVRFVQILRIVLMVTHFKYHFQENSKDTYYNHKHGRGRRRGHNTLSLEIAHRNMGALCRD